MPDPILDRLTEIARDRHFLQCDLVVLAERRSRKSASTRLRDRARRSAFVMAGARWPILVGMLLVRAFISSQLDRAPHLCTSLDRREHALNMRGPRLLQLGLLNFDLHRAHHEHPNLPWCELPARASFVAGDIPFVRAVARQWRGPIAIDELRVATQG